MRGSVEGVYRGICVDARDPLRAGRIRVQVPQVLGATASGWAFPAWAGDDTEVWPEDRLPKPGQGVWVLFEGTDRLTWMAVFGAPEDSKQSLDSIPGAYDTSITISLPNLPPEIPVPVRGSLVSLAGYPGPGAVVRVEKSPDAGEGAIWDRIPGSYPVNYRDGSWGGTLTALEGESGYWYRAVFDGTEPWTGSVSAPARSLTEGHPSVLTWNSPTFPWLVEQTVSGNLRTGGGNAIPDAEVGLYLETSDGFWYHATGMSARTGRDGSWSIRWARGEDATGAFSARAVYLGDRTYQFSQAGPVAVPAVVSATSLSWSFPVVPQTGTAFTATGSLKAVDPVHGVPRPSAAVRVLSRSPSVTTPPEGAWSVSATVPVSPDGSWSVVLPNTSPSTDYRAEFPGAGVFSASAADEKRVVLALTTTTSAPKVPATAVHGQTVAAIGTVVDQIGRPASSGTVAVDVRSAPNGSWVQYGTAPVSNGAYAVSGTIGILGGIEWRARYLANPAGGLLASTSGSTPARVGLSAPSFRSGALQKDLCSVDRTSDVSGVGWYTILVNSDNEADEILMPNWYHVQALSTDSHYRFKIRARQTAPDGSTVSSPWSSTVRCYSGKYEQRRSGEFLWDGGSIGIANYRGTSWDSNGTGAYQGRYSSGNWYRGIIQFDNAAFRTFLHHNHYGSDTWPHISWTKCEIHLFRSGAANDGITRVTPRFWVTDAVPYRGSPEYGDVYLQGGFDSPETVPVNGNAVCRITEKHWAGHVLLEQFVGGRTIRSFAIARDLGSSYMQVTSAWLGVGGSYNYQTQAPVDPYWY